MSFEKWKKVVSLIDLKVMKTRNDCKIACDCVKRANVVLHVQYCRVPKNGLPKNGQAGISPKNKNDPGWKNELRTVHHTQRAFAVKTTSSASLLGLRNDSTSTVWNVSPAFPARHASSHTVCALQANLRDPKTDCKIRTRLAEVVKNKNDPGWDRLPPVLRHPTVL